MRFRHAVAIALLGLSAGLGLLAQRPFKEYPAIEYNNFPIPPDYNKKTEWVRARLRYPDIYGYPFKQLFEQDGTPFPGYWTMDYPRSDRHLLAGVKRLTRIDVRTAEQVVDLDGTDDVYNWPVMYAVEVGHWLLPEDEAKQLGEYLNRGGFLMVDDFHGEREWEIFVQSMQRALPGREIVDLPDNDPIFHTIYDLNDRFQVPGAQYFDSGRTYEAGMDRTVTGAPDYRAGMTPHWRAIYDDKGRVMVAICHNMDLGDAWEVSDEPRYPEKWASLAYRIATNYFVYDLTH
ncbi:MAG TPA: DUF4159 domain-containing protein [Bryobacteraceae bacterium]|nr:DUF4159 domain-containing protein [Bryobacteraceae bacterium]